MVIHYCIPILSDKDDEYSGEAKKEIIKGCPGIFTLLVNNIFALNWLVIVVFDPIGK